MAEKEERELTQTFLHLCLSAYEAGGRAKDLAARIFPPGQPTEETEAAVHRLAEFLLTDLRSVPFPPGVHDAAVDIFLDEVASHMQQLANRAELLGIIAQRLRAVGPPRGQA